MFDYTRVEPMYGEYATDSDGLFDNWVRFARRQRLGLEKSENRDDFAAATGVTRLSSTEAIVDGVRVYGSRASMDRAYGRWQG